MSTPELSGGVNIAMKIPRADYEQRVARYRDALGFEHWIKNPAGVVNLLAERD